MSQADRPMARAARAYYAATLGFLLLDANFGLNLRVAGVEAHPALKAGRYLALIGCLGLVLWRPGWSLVVVTLESLATLLALIFSMAIRVLSGSEHAIESGVGAPGLAECLNFFISGSVAWYAWQRGMRRLGHARRS